MKRIPRVSTSFLQTIAKPFLPPIHTARHYSLYKLRKDLVAGLTVSVVEVPQAMAYAIIAGVPPVYGLYTSIIQGVIGSLLSSSEHMTTGPTNTQSLLIAAAIKSVALPEAPPEAFLQLYLSLVFGLTLLKGLLQLGFAAARLGDLVRYISRSVIVGLVAGAGVLILVGQLPHFLGLDITGVKSHLPGVLGKIEVLDKMTRTFATIGHYNGRALAIGLGVVGIIVGVRLISKLLPGALIAVILSAVTVAAMGWTSPQSLPLIDKIPKGLPHLINPWPGWEYAQQLLPGALALAILGMLESVAIAKSIAAQTGERISANQEFFAQGLKNTMTSFVQCIPGSGSFTRSALDHAAGAETRFAASFNAIFVALFFFLLADWAGYIPMAALAGVLFMIAVGLIDWRYLVRIARTSRGDAFVCFATFLSTLIAPLQYAIFIGILLNLGLFVRKASRLHLNRMVQRDGGPFVEMPIHDRVGNEQVLFLQLEGDLFFAVADELQDRLQMLHNSPVSVVIFRLKRTHTIDTTVLDALEAFIEDMKEHHRHVIFCGVRTELMRTLKNYGMVDLVGKDNIFPAGDNVFSSAKMALQRARDLVNRSIDLQPIQAELTKEEALNYEI